MTKPCDSFKTHFTSFMSLNALSWSKPCSPTKLWPCPDYNYISNLFSSFPTSFLQSRSTTCFTSSQNLQSWWQQFLLAIYMYGTYSLMIKQKQLLLYYSKSRISPLIWVTYIKVSLTCHAHITKNHHNNNNKFLKQELN